MLIEIPVTPFAKKCIVYDLGNEPKITQAHSIYFLLNTDTGVRYELTETIVLSVPTKFKVSSTAGVALHKYYKDLMFETVVNLSNNTKSSARQLMINWLDERGVEEDDYSLDSVYKEYGRFLARRNKKKATYRLIRVQESCRVGFANLEPILLKFFGVKFRPLKGKRVESEFIKIRQAYFFIIHKYGIRQKDIAIFFECPPSTISKSIKKHRSNISIYTDDEISIKTFQVIEQLNLNCNENCTI